MKSLKQSALRQHAIDVLRRARRTPVGAFRNDLRQLAYALRWLEAQQSEGRTPRTDIPANPPASEGDHA